MNRRGEWRDEDGSEDDALRWAFEQRIEEARNAQREAAGQTVLDLDGEA